MSRGVIINNEGALESVLNITTIRALDGDTVYIGEIWISNLSDDDIDAIKTAIEAYSPGGGGGDRYAEGVADGKAAIATSQKLDIANYQVKLRNYDQDIADADIDTNEGQLDVISESYQFIKTPDEITQIQNTAYNNGANEARHLIAIDHQPIAHEYQTLLPDDAEIQAQDASVVSGQKAIFYLSKKYLGQEPTPPTGDVKYFTGNTIIITWAEASLEQRTYKYSSAGNITFGGDLTDFESIEGNGTTNVTVVVKQIPTEYVRHFTITCGTDSDNRVYECELAYWGANLPADTGIMMFETTDESVWSEDGRAVVVHTLVTGTPTFQDAYSTKTAGGKVFTPSQLIGYTFGNYHPTSIPNYFLSFCHVFNQPLNISNVTSIGTYFLYNCNVFNQPLNISNVTSIGNYFLSFCKFNQPLNISNVTSIGNNFLSYCYTFNQPLNISNVTSIGNTFLSYCYTFNQPLNISNVTSIGNNFLSYCYTFNQPLNISNVTSIGDNFLYNCHVFNQPLTIPSSVTSIGTYFLSDCYSFKKLIYEPTTYVPANDNNTLSWASYNRTEEITVSGAGASNLKSRFANRTSSPYRKLVVE